MKTAILLLALSLLSGTTTYAEVPFFKSKKTKKETIAEKKVSAYDKLFASPHPTAKGFITLHKLKNKLYFELPLNLLQRDMLLGSTVSEVSDNGNAIVGSKPSTPIHFRFHKVNGKINMAVARYNCDYCNNMVYDEEMEEYVCDVDMDEDDYARLLTSEYRECPYYQSNDEYKVVRHQM